MPHLDSTPEALGEALAGVAKGDVPLAALVALDADDLAKILALAIARMQVGQDGEAARILRGLVALEPKNPIFHEYLGLALERGGDLAGAIAEYGANIEGLERLGGAVGRLCEGYLLRARLAALQGDVDGARRDLDRSKGYAAAADAQLAQEIAHLERAIAGGPV